MMFVFDIYFIYNILYIKCFYIIYCIQNNNNNSHQFEILSLPKGKVPTKRKTSKEYK